MSVQKESWARESDERSLDLLRKKVDEDAKRGVYDDMPTYWKIWDRAHPGTLPPGVPYWYWKFVPVEALPEFHVGVWEQTVRLQMDDPMADPPDPREPPVEVYASEPDRVDLYTGVRPLDVVLDILFEFYWSRSMEIIFYRVEDNGNLNILSYGPEEYTYTEETYRYKHRVEIKTLSPESAEMLLDWASPSHRE